MFLFNNQGFKIYFQGLLRVLSQILGFRVLVCLEASLFDATPVGCLLGPLQVRVAAARQQGQRLSSFAGHGFQETLGCPILTHIGYWLKEF